MFNCGPGDSAGTYIRKDGAWHGRHLFLMNSGYQDVWYCFCRLPCKYVLLKLCIFNLSAGTNSKEYPKHTIYNSDVFASIINHAIKLMVRLGMALQCCQLNSLVRYHKYASLDSRHHCIVVVIHNYLIVLGFLNQVRLDCDPHGWYHVSEDSFGTGMVSCHPSHHFASNIINLHQLIVVKFRVTNIPWTRFLK
jgi:hypothetical protein